MELSVLNLVPLKEGRTPLKSMEEMVTIAQKAEELGYARYWLAEHHNTRTFLSSATPLLIQHVLANTKTIRAGSGGIMLPNHSPLVVAETFGTLETLYPDRVDLGLGRAPGTDQKTARFLRRGQDLYPDFEEDLEILEGFFQDKYDIHANPGAGLDVPFYILGSSTDSAWLAARLGLPYAFASHFAPQHLDEACRIYHENFQPSSRLAYPYFIIGINALAAETDEKARQLSTTGLRAALNIVTGSSEPIQPPAASEEEVWNQFAGSVENTPHFGPVAFEKEQLKHHLKQAVAGLRGLQLLGSKETIKAQYLALKERLPFDELMITCFLYDLEDHLTSLAILKEAIDEAENG